MIKTLLAGTVVASLLVPLSGAVLAQTNDFMTQEGSDMWRASKLSGVAVYGPDNRKVGNISDVLMDHSGKATTVVIGVGGFLGIGQKDVAVPYDQVHFTDQPMTPPSGSPAPSVEAQTGTTGGGIAPATAVGLGSPATTPAPGVAPGGGISTNSALGLGGTGGASNTAAGGLGMAAPARTVAEDVRSTAYPDHGMIDLTSDQLKSAPAFQFAK